MFLSAGHALDWAYNVAERPLIKIAMINTMRQANSSFRHQNTLLINLTAEESHRQAVQIVNLVAELPDPAAQEYIAARFGRRMSRDDIRIIVYRGCATLGLGLDKQDAVYKVMKGYFGRSGSMRMIRRDLGCRHQNAISAKGLLYDTLDIIHDRSMAEMTTILERHGLIERVYA